MSSNFQEWNQSHVSSTHVSNRHAHAIIHAQSRSSEVRAWGRWNGII